MYYKIQETDEALKDLSHIFLEAYNFTGDSNSGIKFMDLYNSTVENMAIFPDGFSKTDIDYRGYKIRLIPFGNYHMFFIINKQYKTITILRVLYQKQDWNNILVYENDYHLGKDDV